MFRIEVKGCLLACEQTHETRAERVDGNLRDAHELIAAQEPFLPAIQLLESIKKDLNLCLCQPSIAVIHNVLNISLVKARRSLREAKSRTR